MKRSKRLAVFALLLFAAPMAFAQYSIEVQDVETSSFPDLTAKVVMRQNGVIIRTTDSSAFTLKEDGFRQSPLHLVHPVATQGFNLAIIIAVGSTMGAGDVGFATGLAARMVDRMNGLTDEAAIITYDNNVSIRQEMTNTKPMLLDALNTLAPTGGGNYIWNGGYDGVSYLLNNSSHPSRTVVLMSNGKGDGGTRDVQNVIDLAKAGGIKVHCFGINAVNSDAQMRDLCAQTGGTYYSNGDLMVQEVIDGLSGTPAVSELTYRSDNACRDGQARSLDLQVKIADDSVHTTFSFPLAANASGDVTATMKPDTGTVVSGKTKDIALLFTPAVQNQRLYGGTIPLLFDTSKLRLVSASTAGHIADGMGAAVAMTGAGADVTLSGIARLGGSGTVLMLTFEGGIVQANTDVQVQVGTAAFDRGCITVVPGSARITVRPQTASLSTKAQPVVFNWDGGVNRYTPDPGVITVEVTNNGDLPLSGLTATLEESDDVRVAYGASRAIAVNPDTLSPGAKGYAVWYVQAQPQSTEKTAQVMATISSTEGTGAQHRVFLNIKAATSAVAMRCEVDDIAVVGGQYTPDPAQARAIITSAGTSTGPAGDMTIVLPQDITLDGGPSTQAFTAMASGSSATLFWPLRYPRPSVRTGYPILLIRSAAGFPDDTCRVILTVPVLTAPQLEGTCSIAPDIVDSTVTEVTYSITVRNAGNADAINVSASLILPVNLTFAPGEVAGKGVANPLAPNASGSATWKLLPVMVQHCSDTTINIGVLVRQDGGSAAQCVAPLLFKAGNNLLPEILSVSPVTLDTIAPGAEITFDIDVFDQERGALTYEWYVNGVRTAGSGRQFVHTFAGEGDYLVRADVFDPCMAPNEAVSHTWQVYVYNVSGILTPAAAAEFAILGNYPNPFNPGTVIAYRLPEGRHDLRLEVLDPAGRIVRTLVTGEQPGGTHHIAFDATGLPSGQYLVRLATGGMLRTHRMTLLK